MHSSHPREREEPSRAAREAVVDELQKQNEELQKQKRKRESNQFIRPNV